MKSTRWAAVAFGVLTLVIFLAPLSFRVESEAHVWLGFLLLLAAWYVLGPIFLVTTTVLAAVSSVRYLRTAEPSLARRRVVVWSWVALFLLEAGLAVWIVQVNDLASAAFVAVLVGVVLAVTGTSAFFVAKHSSGADRP
ncbi:hypothetical protein [Leucobacter komagatae]|uniref:hypothetical protein n=1 Tax=Leucobacter komagatae TaxID=55969 RepID=UPI0012EE9086|nr:hypothetical protein [Leucobacter komagatae]